MSTRKRTFVIVGGVAVLALIGILTAASIAGKDRNVAKVATAKVGKTDLVSTVSCNGRIQAKKKVDISSQVMGQIVNLAVREGDPVKKGDFLLQIDKAQYDASNRAQDAQIQALIAQRDSDRIQREQAERDFTREKRNFEAGISSEQVLQKARQVLDTARSNELATGQRIEQAKAQLQGSQDSLRKTTLIAPIDGVVTARPVEAGENAIIGTMNNPGTVLLTISDMSIVEAEMEVDETDVPRVKVGQKASMTIDAYPEQKFEGQVTEIGGSPILKSALGTDSSAVNFKVKVQIQNPPKDLRPGFSVAGQIETDRRKDALSIPIPALILADEDSLKRPEKGKKKATGTGQADASPTAPPSAADKGKDGDKKKKEVQGVFVLRKDGTVEFRKVKTGITAELSTEVLEGLTEGEEIITGPFRVLRTLKIGDRAKLDPMAGRSPSGAQGG